MFLIFNEKYKYQSKNIDIYNGIKNYFNIIFYLEQDYDNNINIQEYYTIKLNEEIIFNNFYITAIDIVKENNKNKISIFGKE